MKKFLNLILVSTVVSIGSIAMSSDIYEAFLSEEHFDGKVFSYKLVAPMAKGDVTFEPKILCQYGNFEGPYVSSVEIKIMMTGDFSDPNGSVEKSGSVDIRGAINYCIASHYHPGEPSAIINRAKVAPTTIILPRISVPQAVVVER